MSKTGVRLGEWKSKVNKANTSVQDIGKLTDMELSKNKTDLTGFTLFENLSQEINKSIGSYQNFAGKDTQKMIKVGENKKNDDTAGAVAMRGVIQ